MFCKKKEHLFIEISSDLYLTDLCSTYCPSVRSYDCHSQNDNSREAHPLRCRINGDFEVEATSILLHMYFIYMCMYSEFRLCSVFAASVTLFNATAALYVVYTYIYTDNMYKENNQSVLV